MAATETKEKNKGVGDGVRSISRIKSSSRHEVTIPIPVFRCSDFGGCIREMSQSLSNNVPDNTLEQEATTGHFTPRRLNSPTLQATQFPELELTLTLVTGHDITFSDGKPASETSELNPKDVTARLEDLEVEIDTLHADTEDKELLIFELQDSLIATENEIAILQIRVADTEGRRAEDHEQILARLVL
ncbi:hypothetical protein Tco_0190015 [Tanacetum coccineum]